MSSTEQLKFEENIFYFSRVFPQWYKKPWLWTIIYHWGNTLIKKKQFFLNFSFPIEDAEKWIKHHFFVLKKIHKWSKFQGYISKNRTATPLRSSKLKWAWQSQFLSHNLQILGKYLFFQNLQMIVKPSLAKSNGTEFGKKWSSPLSMCKGVLDYSHWWRQKILSNLTEKSNGRQRT